MHYSPTAKLSLSNAVTYLKQYKYNGVKIQKFFLVAATVAAASLLMQQRAVSSALNHIVTRNPAMLLYFPLHSKFLIRVISALPGK
jgi:hypothetical protein